MSVPQTSDGFWRSFDRDHEAVPLQHGINPKPDGSKTTQHGGFQSNHFSCLECDMPCHLETVLISAVSETAHTRPEQHAWVAKHGPAPHSSIVRDKTLAGTTPVIELPDAVGVAESQTKRHLLLPEQDPRLMMQAACGQRDLYRYRLGQCWQIPPCENLKLFR